MQKELSGLLNSYLNCSRVQHTHEYYRLLSLRSHRINGCNNDTYPLSDQLERIAN